ncbi:maleylpyruvate isomerase family mycothiol-dependent enzyme [Parafrankia discariae]|uniref:maleylpyruvate isomerase family mycothiol-dependent enzyme n=1 Tax=Parafrankia discariae TaxID=365528 RepID=UPI00039F4011|nr:maleylpyruvate isomerase family mycothiol-dependent enzyme [Parafrankia discariae]
MGIISTVEIFDDLAAEGDRLEAILDGLGDARWAAPSAAAGWSVADVVLHLAQSEEAVAASVDGRPSPLLTGTSGSDGGTSTVDDLMDVWVRRERAAPSAVFERWRTARHAALAALRRADPGSQLRWVAAPLRPATLAVTRIAEHWAHGLDITSPFGIDFPDTARLRHIAWLGHRTLPYSFIIAGAEPHEVYCELTAPDGSAWRYGPPAAASTVTGSAGAFCRVGAGRLDPAASGLVARGPHAELALRVLRNYAS